MEQIQNSQQTDILPPEVDYTVAAWKSISVNRPDEKPAVQATYMFFTFPIYPVTHSYNSASVYPVFLIPEASVVYRTISVTRGVLQLSKKQYV